jgi:sigma-B regulation protein RsbU (phosphoserine phosphatase)
MSILIVDDSEDARCLLISLLRRAGYQQLLTAASAAEALAHLGTSSVSNDESGIDLMLLDIDMPAINGIEACRRVKVDPCFRDMPVIMVTSHSDDQVLADAFAAGAMDYITKPFRPVELLARVRSALTLKQEMKARKAREEELITKNSDLQRALQEIQTLRGLIKICSFCKRIQNDQGGWERLELYIREHSEAEFSHGICEECSRTHYPGLLKR